MPAAGAVQCERCQQQEVPQQEVPRAARARGATLLFEDVGSESRFAVINDDIRGQFRTISERWVSLGPYEASSAQNRDVDADGSRSK